MNRNNERVRKQCNQSFTQLGTLYRHKKYHSGERPLSCHHCNKTFVEEIRLKNHMGVHIKPKSVSCNMCGKSLRNASLLRKHQVVHTGERRFKCKTCEKSFGQRGVLTRHMTTHGAFACGQCEKYCVNEIELHSLQQRHPKVICDTCKKNFKNKDNWVIFTWTLKNRFILQGATFSKQIIRNYRFMYQQ